MLRRISENTTCIRAKITWLDFSARFRRDKGSSDYQAGSSPFTDILPVLNDRGQRIGSARRLDVHSSRLIHPTVHLLLFNSQGELLVQKRGMRKDQSPGKLASSVGGMWQRAKLLKKR